MSMWPIIFVSTAHVSCGALFGIGIANGQARWPIIRTTIGLVAHAADLGVFVRGALLGVDKIDLDAVPRHNE